MSHLSRLPIQQTFSPSTGEELEEAVALSAREDWGIYPVGGGTSVNFGVQPSKPGIALQLGALDQIVDYPHRDLTITVNAGITLQQLGQALAEHQQFVPLDVPNPAAATLGGTVATNPLGPRYYYYRGIRDYVIGIHAIDAQGQRFRAGGRVVKNVAGYDFCKLLTGSLGTLGVIATLTLKLLPQPQCTRFVVIPLQHLEDADRTLAHWMLSSPIRPAAIQLLSGPYWQPDFETLLGSAPRCALVVVLDGMSREVEWMQTQLLQELNSEHAQALDAGQFAKSWERIVHFPAHGAGSVLQFTCLPSRLAAVMRELEDGQPDCSMMAHAGSGVLYVHFDSVPDDQFARLVVSRFQPLAAAAGGHTIILSTETASGLTRRMIWGTPTAPLSLLQRVKDQFDPHNILNPGRFLFP